jgi:3-oxoacyl-[acyl-carrier protein] reductase
MTDSVAIVAGASQEIGRATAVRLAKDFSKLVMVARNGANLKETAKMVQDVGAESLALDLDLSVVAGAETVVSKTSNVLAGSTRF